MFCFQPFSWGPFSYLMDMTLPETVVVPAGSSVLNITAEIYTSGGTPIYVAMLWFITRPTDTLSNQQFEPRLKKGFEFEQSIVDGNGFTGGTSSYGALALEDSDRRYETIFQSNTLDGRRVVIRAVQLILPDQPGSYDTAVVLFDGIAVDWHHDGTEITIELQANAFKLEVPACSGVYGGTGGADGTADMAGKRKPRALGSNVPTNGSGGNATPALIDPVNRIYQVNDGPVLSIPDVYDGGNALEGPDGDYATYAAMAADIASIVDGHYKTCLAVGMLAVGAPPEQEITCDVLGDSSGTGYVNDTAAIYRRLIRLSAPLIDLVDEGTFFALSAAQPAAVGIYLGLDDNRTVKQVGDELLGGIGGWHNFRGSGVLEVGRLTSPAAVAVDRFTTADIVDDSMQRLQLPDGVNPPPKRQGVTYANNWTVQPNPLAGVSAARREMLKLAFSVGPHSNTTLADAIEDDHLSAQEPEPIHGFFALLAPAVAEADRVLSLHGSVTRSMYSYTDKSGRGMLRKIGETVELDYPLFDLEGGKNVVIVGLKFNTTENETTITVWG